MTDDLLQYFDAEGNPLSVGTRVKYFEQPGVGTVVSIEDPEGDVDDDTGRSIMNGPWLTVRYEDGQEEQYTGHLKATRLVGMDKDGEPLDYAADFEFEEIEIA